MNVINARVELRAQRRELRALRHSSASTPAPVAPNAIEHNSIALLGPPIVPGNGQNHLRELRRAARQNYLPGQISTFRTSRPQTSDVRSTYLSGNGNNRNIHNGVSLDLSSTNTNITVGSNLLGDSSATISIGEGTKEIVAGTKVTAAEYAALNQKLVTGAQGLTLNSSGAATDGALNINLVSDAGRTIRTSELVIPQGVEVSGDLGRRADGVRVNNDLVNFGSLYATSSNRRTTTAIIGARDISNQQSGLITTDVPASIASQFGSTNSKLNLALRADRDLNNQGQITSSGDLELSAGRSFSNSGMVQARGTVSLNANQIQNQGLVTSMTESVAVSAPTNSHLFIDNTGGEIRALSGNINIATIPRSYPKTNTTLVGGDWHSKELNIVSGDGAVSADVGDVTGLVNITGGSAQFNSTAATLLMGEMNTTGDPLISNAGNVVIMSNQITNGQPLSIIAGQDITVNPGVTTLDTSSSGGTGGTMLLVAGANFTVPADLHITGGLAAGGSIDLTGLTTLRTGGTGTGTVNGGNLQILAFGGAGKGTVTVPSAVTITTGGSGVGGSNGSITITGGATSGSAVNVGQLNTRGGGTGASGTIAVFAAAPTVAVSPVIIETSAGPTQGNINSGSFGTGAATAGNIITGDLRTNGKAVTVSGGGSIISGNIFTDGQNAGVNGGGVFVSGTTSVTTLLITTSANFSNTAGGAVSVNATAGPITAFDITAGGNGTGKSGIVNIGSPGTTAINVEALNSSGSATSDGGPVTVTATSSSTVTIGNVLTTSDLGNGGSVSITNLGNGGLSVNAIDTQSIGAGGSGGNVQATASGTGNIDLPNGIFILTSGATNNGNVTLSGANVVSMDDIEITATGAGPLCL